MPPRKNRKKLMRRYVLFCDYIKEHKIYPTLRDLMEIWGLKTTSAVHHSLQQMMEEGWLDHYSKSNISYRLPELDVVLPYRYFQLKQEVKANE